MLMKGQPGDVYVMRYQLTEEYELAQSDADGVIRDEQGRSYSNGAYNVVHRIDACEGCGNDELESFTLIKGTDVLVCQECGHR